MFDVRADVLISQYAFLTLCKNREKIIDWLAAELENDEHKVSRCPSDADAEVAGNRKTVTTIAEDTNIFESMLYFWNSELSNIYTHPEPPRNQKVKETYIKITVEKMNPMSLSKISSFTCMGWLLYLDLLRGIC